MLDLNLTIKNDFIDDQAILTPGELVKLKNQPGELF
jgi:hypothetical protein